MPAAPSWFWPAFLVGTAALMLFSWLFSVRAKRYHGISRFFAFECILALALLNIPVWFRRPFSLLQVLSWFFLMASFLLVAYSLALYHRLGAPRGEFENSTRLVVEGAYKYIRHPMYSSLALLGLGVFFKRVTSLTAMLAAVDLFALYVTARVEEKEMGSRFGSEYSDYKLRTKMFLPFLFLILGICVLPAPAQTPPFARYTVTPEPDGSRLTIEAELRLVNSPAYLKDFNQLDSIRWFQDGREIPVAAERSGDLLIFKGLPVFGDAGALYRLRCVTDPEPGYRKRLMGSPVFLMAREGLFIGFNGRELGEVDVEWRLPPGWTLALGRSGIQRYVETQRTIWVAGRMADVSSSTIGGKNFRIAVLEGVPAAQAAGSIEALKKIFLYARENFGELDEGEFSVALFPRGSIGGGTALYWSLVGEDNLLTVVHEMLHWWTNFLAPAWFREGAHDYITLKVMVEQGVLPPSALKGAFNSYLQERLRVVKREGKVVSLAESSEAYDAQKPSGDIYAFAPLFAAKLDREIQARAPKSSLEQVFAAVCRARIRPGRTAAARQEIDIPALIKEITGYDPTAFFDKHFFVPVEDAEIMLK